MANVIASSKSINGSSPDNITITIAAGDNFTFPLRQFKDNTANFLVQILLDLRSASSATDGNLYLAGVFMGTVEPSGLSTMKVLYTASSAIAVVNLTYGSTDTTVELSVPQTGALFSGDSVVTVSGGNIDTTAANSILAVSGR